MRFLFFAFLLLCACSSPPKQPAALNLAFNGSPATLDPRKSGDFLSSTLICLIYEGLTRCVPGGGIEPGLAEKWEVSPDGCVYTFFLRHAYWSDGKPITAFDFEASWKKILDPASSSPSAYLLFPIKNGERYAKREVFSEEVAVRALDANTLRVELERPTPFFLSLTAFPLFLPAPQHADPERGAVSSGPFCIASYKPNQEIRLVKNPQFWNKKKIALDSIRIQIVPDENTALQLFERGEIDWLGAPLAPLPLDALQSLSSRLQYLPMDASTFVAFNTQRFPFNNLKLRQALSLCLDREKIVREIALHGQIPASRCLPPSLFERPLKPLFAATDPEKARKSFEEALAELGVDRLDFTLYCKTTQLDKRLAQALQREWKEALGVDVQIELLEPKAHLDRLHRREFEIALAAWIAQFHDPVNLLERYRLPTNPKNFAGWENKAYQALLEEASSEWNPERRLNLLAEAEELFATALPLIPLCHWVNPSLSHPRLGSIATTPSGGVLFEKFQFIEPISSVPQR